MNQLSSLVSVVVLAGAVSGVSATPANHLTELQDDGRICGQPFAGQVIQVSCHNIAGIIESQGGPNNVRFVPTRDGKNGEQFNQINDKDGNPIVLIYTPPGTKGRKNN